MIRRVRRYGGAVRDEQRIGPRHRPKARRTRMSPEARREQLIELGLTMVRECPIEDVSIDAIADAAGVSARCCSLLRVQTGFPRRTGPGAGRSDARLHHPTPPSVIRLRS